MFWRDVKSPMYDEICNWNLKPALWSWILCNSVYMYKTKYNTTKKHYCQLNCKCFPPSSEWFFSFSISYFLIKIEEQTSKDNQLLTSFLTVCHKHVFLNNDPSLNNFLKMWNNFRWKTWEKNLFSFSLFLSFQMKP